MRDLALGLFQRAWIFLRRAGTIIFTVAVVLWLLLNFPRAEPGHSQVDASIAGTVANGLAVVVKPIGFNRDIALALIPAMARTRSRGVLAGDDLCGRFPRQDADRSRARPAAQGALELANGARFSRLVRVRAAVPVDHRRRPA